MATACGPTTATTDTTGTTGTDSGETTATTTTSGDDPTDEVPTTDTTAPPECRSNADCARCFDCIDGACVGAPLCEEPSGECVLDEDCDADQICQDDFCVPIPPPLLPQCRPAATVTTEFAIVGEAMSALTLAQLDGDALVDLVFALPGPGVVQIGLNEGLGEFPVVATAQVGGPAKHLALATGDVDADGDLDIVVARDGDDPGIVALLNVDGQFMPGPVQPGSPGVRSLYLTDVEGDSTLDVVAVHGGTPHVGVHLGDGAGNFGDELDPGVEESVGEQSSLVLWTGIEADALLAPFPEAQELRMLLTQPEGPFTALRSFPTLVPTDSALAGDLDLDGLPDVVAVAPGVAQVWLGTFEDVWAAAPTDFLTLQALQGGALVEYDGEPGLDLVASTIGTKIVVLHGDGVGGFACEDPIDAVPTLPALLAVGDIDGDGDTDIVAGTLDGTIATLRAQ